LSINLPPAYVYAVFPLRSPVRHLVITLQCEQTHNARRRALGSLQPRAPSLGRSLRESIYDGATASTGSSFIALNVEYAVVIFIVFLDHHGDATSCGK